MSFRLGFVSQGSPRTDLKLLRTRGLCTAGRVRDMKVQGLVVDVEETDQCTRRGTHAWKHNLSDLTSHSQHIDSQTVRRRLSGNTKPGTRLVHRDTKAGYKEDGQPNVYLSFYAWFFLSPFF